MYDQRNIKLRLSLFLPSSCLLVKFSLVEEYRTKQGKLEIYKTMKHNSRCTRDGTLIVATIYLQLIKNRYMFRSFTVLQALVTST